VYIKLKALIIYYFQALVGGQFVKSPQVGEKCDSYCPNGARCVRGLCECNDGYTTDSTGYCQPTDQTVSQTGNEVIEPQSVSATDQSFSQGQNAYMVDS
jgi:hypothetical protein